jgi:hypothetical protein
MDNLFSGFRALPEVDVPAGLHTSIMRRVLFAQHRSFLRRFAVILALNVALAAWSVWSTIEADTLETVRSVVSDVQMSYLSLTDGALALREVVPLRALLGVFLNLASIVYLLILFRDERWKLAKVEPSGSN